MGARNGTLDGHFSYHWNGGYNQAWSGASGIRLVDQLDHLPPVRGAGQPSASSEQEPKASPKE